MDLHPPSDSTDAPAVRHRAGLRIDFVPDRPTSLFEAVELAVLVIVTALALVSIIVANSEYSGDRRRETASRIDRDVRPVAREAAGHDTAARDAPAAGHGPAVVASSR